MRQFARHGCQAIHGQTRHMRCVCLIDSCLDGCRQLPILRRTRFIQDRRRPARERIGQVNTAIGKMPRISQKDIARRYRARIISQAFDCNALHCKRLQQASCLQNGRFTHMTSCTGSFFAALFSGLNGASDGTPSERKLPAMICEKTGAATCPP